MHSSIIIYDNLHIMVLPHPIDEEVGGRRQELGGRRWNPHGETVIRLLYVTNGGAWWGCGIKRRLHLMVNESVRHAAGGDGEKRVISVISVVITEGRLMPRTAGPGAGVIKLKAAVKVKVKVQSNLLFPFKG